MIIVVGAEEIASMVYERGQRENGVRFAPSKDVNDTSHVKASRDYDLDSR